MQNVRSRCGTHALTVTLEYREGGRLDDKNESRHNKPTKYRSGAPRTPQRKTSRAATDAFFFACYLGLRGPNHSCPLTGSTSSTAFDEAQPIVPFASSRCAHALSTCSKQTIDSKSVSKEVASQRRIGIRKVCRRCCLFECVGLARRRRRQSLSSRRRRHTSSHVESY